MQLPEDHPEIVIYFILASIFLWMGIGWWLLPGGYRQSRGEIVATFSIIACFISVALFFSYMIARLFSRPAQGGQADVRF